MLGEDREPEPMPVLLLAARLVQPDIQEVAWVGELWNGLIRFTGISKTGGHRDFEFDLNRGTIAELFRPSQHRVTGKGVAIEVIVRRNLNRQPPHD
jgi:hypothetical protein